MTHGNKVRENIIEAGLKLWPNVSARAIGRTLKMSHGAVLYHFGDIEELRNAVAKQAIADGNSEIIAQLIISKHATIADMPVQIRKQYLSTIQ